MCSTIFTSIVGPVVGGAIAATAGFSLAFWKWRRDGKDRFISIICEMEASIDSGDGTNSDARSVHSSFITKLRSAVFAVQPFICDASFNRLLKIWQEYKNEDGSARGAFKRDTRAEGIVKQTPEPYTLETLRAYLQKMKDEVG
jgi:hypothetical protein